MIGTGKQQQDVEPSSSHLRKSGINTSSVRPQEDTCNAHSANDSTLMKEMGKRMESEFQTISFAENAHFLHCVSLLPEQTAVSTRAVQFSIQKFLGGREAVLSADARITCGRSRKEEKLAPVLLTVAALSRLGLLDTRMEDALLERARVRTLADVKQLETFVSMRTALISGRGSRGSSTEAKALSPSQCSELALNQLLLEAGVVKAKHRST